MIRSPLGLRVEPDPDRSPRDQIREAARAGAKGVVLDASGDLAPDRLSETGRRDIRHTLRSAELALIALNLPTRRPLDTLDGLDLRLARADRAFALAYELGTNLLLVKPGPLPGEVHANRREALHHALSEMGKRADHRGVRLAIETGSEPGAALAAVLDAVGSPGLAASLEPAAIGRSGNDPAASVRALASWLAHAYAPDPEGTSARGVFRTGTAAFAAGPVDWEEYLGALEEVAYRGFLTIWPDPNGDPVAAFGAIKNRLDRF